MLSLACSDTGAKVIAPEKCDYVARGRTEEELWIDATAHIVKEHGMKIEDITQQFKHFNKQYIKHS
jgi:predicted small metal-binding protein